MAVAVLVPVEIAADAVTAGKILAGAVTSSKVAANAISSDKLDATVINVNIAIGILIFSFSTLILASKTNSNITNSSDNNNIQCK